MTGRDLSMALFANGARKLSKPFVERRAVVRDAVDEKLTQLVNRITADRDRLKRENAELRKLIHDQQRLLDVADMRGPSRAAVAQLDAQALESPASFRRDGLHQDMRAPVTLREADGPSRATEEAIGARSSEAP